MKREIDLYQHILTEPIYVNSRLSWLNHCRIILRKLQIHSTKAKKKNENGNK